MRAPALLTTLLSSPVRLLLPPSALWPATSPALAGGSTLSGGFTAGAFTGALCTFSGGALSPFSPLSTLSAVIVATFASPFAAFASPLLALGTLSLPSPISSALGC